MPVRIVILITLLISLLTANASMADTKTNSQTIADTPSGTYEGEVTHAYITFSYDHQGYSRPYLRFRKFDTRLILDNTAPQNSSVEVDIDAASIDSGVDIFDEHLRGEKFFDVANHPAITFKSTALTQTSAAQGVMTGDLTIKGQSHPVTLNVTFNKAGQNRAGKAALGFSAKGALKRSDWGLGFAVPYVSDKVDLIIEIEMQKAD